MLCVTQTREGNDGDCIAACIATITGLQLELVPDVNGQRLHPFKNGPWWVRLDHALHPLGYGLLVTRVDLLRQMCPCPGTLCVLLGKSPRETGHAVVGRITDAIGFEQVWDPHWDRGGLVHVEHLLWLLTWRNDS